MERVLRCQNLLNAAPQQSPIKKLISLTSAQVFKDEQWVQRGVNATLYGPFLSLHHLTARSLVRIRADEDTRSTFSGDSCLYFEPNDIGNNDDQGGVGVESGQWKAGWRVLPILYAE